MPAKALTANEDAGCIGLFAGKPAPTGIALSLSYCPPRETPCVPNAILRLALPSPLRRLFDYRAPAGVLRAQLHPGMRLRVPFGRREMIGILVEVTDTSAKVDVVGADGREVTVEMLPVEGAWKVKTVVAA